MSDSAGVDGALRRLVERVLLRIERHPHGYLLPRAERQVEVTVSLPLSLDPAALADAARQLEGALDEAVDETLAHAAAFRPGYVLCLRDGRSDCEHARPGEARHVFAGYSPTGTPRYVDFGQLLLERHDPRVAELYQEDSATLVTCVMTEADLTGELLPSFRDARRDYRIHGQVAAGWYRLPDIAGRRQALAVTVQVVSSRPASGRRRFGLNVVACAPDGESLDHLHERLGAIPWIPAVRWAQSVLHRIAAEQRGRLPEPLLAKRVEGLLGGLARRIARVQRSRDRRTHHAEERHGGGDRPTRMAVLDLSRADDDAILVDTRRRTVVVLGDRGRAHVFNEEGKLVTSVRYPPHTIARRRENGLWRPATPAEAAQFRTRALGSCP